MNTNKKKILFVLLLLFIPLLTCSGNDDNLSTGETVLKITDVEKDIEVNLEFKQTGSKKLTIENHLQKDVEIGGLFYIGDLFTTTPITRSISTEGSHTGCSTIKAGTFCTLIINAAENASTTINPDGEILLLNYGIVGEQKNRFAKLKTKITYNQDIIFKVRNLEFTDKPTHKFYNNYNDSPFIGSYPKEGSSGEYFYFPYSQKKLTIENNNATNTINITNVKVLKDDPKITIGDYKGCSNLKSGASCEVELTLLNSDAKNADIPIHVTYDVIDDNNVVLKKDLIAIAAAIIRSNNDKNAGKTQPGRAIANGVGIATAIIMANGPVRDLIVGQIGDGFVTTNILGASLGVGYSASDAFVAKSFGKEEYNGDKSANKFIATTALHTELGIVYCLPSPNFAVCLVLRVGCGLMSAFGTQIISDSIYSNVRLRLPEQNRGTILLNKTKLTFNLAASETIRFICRAEANNMFEEVVIPGVSPIGIYKEVVAGATMTGIGELEQYLSSNKSIPGGGEPHSISDSDCLQRGCICGHLQCKSPSLYTETLGSV